MLPSSWNQILPAGPPSSSPRSGSDHWSPQGSFIKYTYLSISKHVLKIHEFQYLNATCLKHGKSWEFCLVGERDLFYSSSSLLLMVIFVFWILCVFGIIVGIVFKPILVRKWGNLGESRWQLYDYRPPPGKRAQGVFFIFVTDAIREIVSVWIF